MGLGPKTMFKILQAAGVKIRFDVDNKALIITNDDGEQTHSFDEIEKMVNGDG